MVPIILIVDDQSDIVDLLVDELQSAEFELVSATSFEQAFDFITSLAENAPFRAIITDQYLDNGNHGNELLDLTSTLFPLAYRAILSGANDLSLTLQALNSSLVDKYITKDQNIIPSILDVIDISIHSSVSIPTHIRKYNGLVKNRFDQFTSLFPDHKQRYIEIANTLVDQIDTDSVDSAAIDRWFQSDTEHLFRQHIAMLSQLAYSDPSPKNNASILNTSIFHTLSLNKADWDSAYSNIRAMILDTSLSSI